MQTPHIQGVPDLGPGVRLHLNENTGGCSAAVVEAVRAFDARALATYPDYRAAVLETAAFHGVDAERLVLTNGLDEGILLTAIAYLGGRTPTALVDAGAPLVLPNGQPEVVMARPAFEPYVSTAKALGARIVFVPPGPDYAFPLDDMLAAVTANTRLIYVNNPNNPTGQPVAKDAIRRIIAAAGHALVFLDEAYHDFMGENFLEEGQSHPNVIVGRTFSKAHGLAGMRVGVMIAPPPILEPIRFVMPLFNLNVVAVEALRAALKDKTFTPWYLAQVRESKEMLYAALERVGLRYWKSAANFVLVDGGARTREIVDGLIARGVLVRDRSRDSSCPNGIRITTGVVEHTAQAVRALEDLCGKA
jgi:histidinol-phosphate aminotransferase